MHTILFSQQQGLQDSQQNTQKSTFMHHHHPYDNIPEISGPS